MFLHRDSISSALPERDLNEVDVQDQVLRRQMTR